MPAKRRLSRAMKKVFVFLSLIYLTPFMSKGYSVLTHEAIIDACWKSSIEPFLLERFPGATTGGLVEAHAYAYGGSIVPDIGYYPFGSKLFTNLVHNVRTGDFVTTLIDEARTLNEYAFALGVLSHYMADNYGHSMATNVVVPLAFSKIKSKFGEVVTYADHKKSHSRVEFGFDLLQMARENYSSMSYRQFIGFKISKDVLERAFLKTYSVTMDEVFSNISLALISFRWSVKTLFPTVIKASLINRKAEINKRDPGAISRAFSAKMKNKIRVHQFEQDYENTGITATILSAILPVLPKVGPLAKLRFKPLSPEAEKLFVSSFDTATARYDAALFSLKSGGLTLLNRVLDTGNETVAGEYSITDSNYDALLLLLKDHNYDHLTAECKDDLISFYSKREALNSGKNHLKIRTALTLLKAAAVKDNGRVLSYENKNEDLVDDME